MPDRFTVDAECCDSCRYCAEQLAPDGDGICEKGWVSPVMMSLTHPERRVLPTEVCPGRVDYETREQTPRAAIGGKR